MSLINLKELAEQENSKVAEKNVKCKEIVKVCCIGCVSTFSDPVQLIYIAYANKS